MSSQSFIARNTQFPLPQYLPDATLGVVRHLTAAEVGQLGILGAVVNTYHLKDTPGLEVLQTFGGIKKFMSWPGLVVSDSGGFQLFSLIHKHPELGKIMDEGLVQYTGPKQQHKTLFTPELSIQVQFAIGSDIMICLDDFTPPNADLARAAASVARTTAWAKRAKAEFVRQLEQHGFSGLNDPARPLLLAPIQGHNFNDLRKTSAEALLEIGFDAYGLGGWPFLENGQFDYDFCQYNASLTPEPFLRFALGVGTPSNIVKLWQMGYGLFDCVMPTRDARHHRLYVWHPEITQLPQTAAALCQLDKDNPTWATSLYINRLAWAKDDQPIDKNCDCPTCQTYSKAYLHHLFKVQEGLAFKLATQHNLRFYAKVMEILRRG